MKNFFRKASAFLRNHNYVIERNCDKSCSIYSPEDQETPIFSCAVRGGFKLSLLRIVAICSGICSVMLFLSSLGGKKKKCKKKSKNK